jgi:histidinol dehydrogenase
MKRLKYTSRGFWKRLESFAEEGDSADSVRESVSRILEEVKARGDEALIELSERFDGFRSSAKDLRIPEVVLKEAASSLTPLQKRSIREAIRCVESFHRKALPQNWTAPNPHGAEVGERWYPIERVGVYIPAGNVPLVSTVVMTLPLARLAGVSEIAVFTPAGRDGSISPQMLAALDLCGAREVYRVGGAQAIAAMAYGTKRIQRVDKVMGPGNAYVAEAQRQVFGRVGVDLLPGPSEAMLIADASARIDWLAADLLAQAEHGSGRERVYLVTTDEAQAQAVEARAKELCTGLRHEKLIRKILAERAVCILVPEETAAVEVANFVAPEHLELHVGARVANRMVRSIQTAGAILMGHETPTVIGDFTAGPSHTLPTARTGRFFSGLKVTDFMRRSSLVRYNRAALEASRKTVQAFAEMEHLDAHGQSMEIRFDKRERG